MDVKALEYYAYICVAMVSLVFSLRLLWFLRDRALAGSMIFLRARKVSMLMDRFYLFLSLPLVLVMSLGVIMDLAGWTWLQPFQDFFILIAFVGGGYFFIALSMQISGRGVS